MRKYEPKDDKSTKDYYKDPFFIVKESEKKEVEKSLFEEDANALKSFDIGSCYIEFDQLVINVKKEQILEILKTLKDRGYEILSELSAVDFLEKRGVFEIFYQLLNIKDIKRARVKTTIKQKEFLQSVTPLFKSANWAERELYDMFGVFIKDHPNLSRILMPDDWYGHPLLKSYPLQGDESAKWYEVDKIFGKEYRQIIGEENRDPAFVDSKDTFNFSRIYHECAFGQNPPSKPSLQEYQEEGGVRLVKKPSRQNYKTIKKRR